ncbi:hypothetical protein GLAREA_02179 [Glarea lozoyensis ATCC 20868]|uniref:Apple domain-containing protein n=1 Tax=Glarea lozoyensis (strain ATCC 20868 / MF5171) TaxID=1116229 RepID=S3CIG6_GLAL2|nr:uncharacterized protein GLAREA_02179 [Glarea lozoyensis ATCC 20868]EPE26267.1 hypothetical protein GLAREA_02179 [Glarea lozoyensis ATCC 20868]
MIFPVLLVIGASLVTASPHQNVVTTKPELDLKPRATPAGGWTFGPQCTTNSYIISLVSKMNHPPDPSFTPSPFCSSYLQPYIDLLVPSTLLGSTTLTRTISLTTTTTTTNPTPTTTVLLCATPSPSALCGVSGTFKSEFLEGALIYHANPYVKDGKTCKQACLRNEKCMSFVTYDSTRDGSSCDMYGVSLSEGWMRNPGDEDNANHWFDRSCPELQPPACLAPALAKRYPIALPEFLRNDEWFLGEACSCVVTSAMMTTTGTIRYDVDLRTKFSTRSTQTATVTSTSLAHLSTSYSFVQR